MKCISRPRDGWMQGQMGPGGFVGQGSRHRLVSRCPSSFYKTATSRKQLLKQRAGNRPKSSTSLLSRDRKMPVWIPKETQLVLVCVGGKNCSVGPGFTATHPAARRSHPPWI